MIACYEEPNREVELYLCGTGFYATSPFGPDATTLTKQKPYLMKRDRYTNQLSGRFEIVSSFEELYTMLDRIRDRLNQIAEQYTRTQKH